jgi:hypothetical protein
MNDDLNPDRSSSNQMERSSSKQFRISNRSPLKAINNQMQSRNNYFSNHEDEDHETMSNSLTNRQLNTFKKKHGYNNNSDQEDNTSQQVLYKNSRIQLNDSAGEYLLASNSRRRSKLNNYRNDQDDDHFLRQNISTVRSISPSPASTSNDEGSLLSYLIFHNIINY